MRWNSSIYSEKVVLRICFTRTQHGPSAASDNGTFTFGAQDSQDWEVYSLSLKKRKGRGR